MFLLFNSLMIKFTLKYQKSILEQPDFFKKLNNQSETRTNLFNFLAYYRNNESFGNEMSIMIRSLYNYVQLRKQKSETLTREGKIEYEDNDIYFNEEFCFDRGRTIKSEKSIKLDEELPHIIKENNFEQPIQIQSKRAIKKSQVVMGKGLVEQMREISKPPTYSQAESWYQDFEQHVFTLNKNK